MENKIQKLRRRKENMYSSCNYDLLYRYCVELGQLFLQNEDYENAVVEFKEAVQVGEMSEIPMHVAKANRMIGEVYIMMQKPTEAINHVRKYLDLSKKEGDMKEEQRAFATLARIYFIQAESLCSSAERNTALEQAEKYNIKSLKICERLKEETSTSPKDIAEMKARVYLNLGLVLEAQDLTDKAIEHLEKAVCICRNLDLWEELCLSYTNLGLAYKHKEDTANALKAFDLGLAVAARLPEKSKSMCDLLMLKAGVLFDLPDFRGAKHALHKAYKLKTPEMKDQLEIKRKLKIVAAICKLEESILNLDEDNIMEKRKIYESMGDGCAGMESYKKALEYYHLTLKCLEQLEEKGKKLAEIYVSLAQTYKDIKEYDKAVDYYNREFSIWKNNPAEACNTTLSIADVLELRGAPSKEIVPLYKSAQCLAKDAKNLKLERTVIKSLLHHLTETKNSTLTEDVEHELSVIESQLGTELQSSSESDSDSEEEGTPCIGDHICLETLTDSELDEEVENSEKPRTARRTRGTFHMRRNEKGESPLHVACISGNLTLVQKLLDQGHPVDVRDNNGWLPLHEAANYGYVDIVRELLDKGAAINDRGGPNCGGVTPLLDASSCGHFLVMDLLLEKGASPTMRTNKGETVVDCLKGWRDRYIIEEHSDLKGETLRDYNTMMRKIKTSIEKAGHKVSSVQPTSSTNEFLTQLDRRSNRETASTQSVSRRGDKSLGHRTQRSNYAGQRSENDAVSEYENAMKGLKHRTVNTEVPVSPIKESQDALVCADNVVDDWLIDDMGDSGPSRPLKRRRKGEDFLGQQMRNSNSNSRRPQHIGLSTRPPSSSSLSSGTQDNEIESVESDNVEKENSVSPPRPSNEASMEFEDFIEGSQVQDESIILPIRQEPTALLTKKLSASRKRQTTLLNAGICRQKISPVSQESVRNVTSHSTSDTNVERTEMAFSSTSFNAVHVHKTQTVKVRVEGKLLLIVLPSDPNLTLSWLAEEAARRYHSMEGMEPKLALQTVEGALLYPHDPLSLVLDLGSEVHAAVTSWNLASITERYKEACVAAKVDVLAEVEAQLDACQATTCLDLANYALATSEFIPVFKALAHHHSLQCVRLSGNCLCDSGLKVLVETLVRMTQLRELDISCCNITNDGFSQMAQYIIQNRYFQVLEVLDVSFNPLGDECIRPLSSLLSVLPTLHTLRIASVSLTSLKGQHDFQLERLEVLDISYNKIGREGAQEFLSKLDPDRVCSLNFAAVGQSVAREMAIFLGQCVPHNLASLNLSYCDIEDCEMNALIECLQLCPQLQDLQLAGNTKLSPCVVQKLCRFQLNRLNLSGVTCNPQNLEHNIDNLCISFSQISNNGSRTPFCLFSNNLNTLLGVN